MSAEARLDALGLTLPPLPPPSGTYLLGREHRGILWLAGQGPRDADGILATGRLGDTLTAEQGYAHAALTGLTVLAAARSVIGDLDRIEAVLDLFGIVNATPDFESHTAVMNGCSDILERVLGEAGQHPRATVGVASLARGISVEVVTRFALKD